MISSGSGRTELLIGGGIVAIVRLEQECDLAPAIEAICNGGVTALEILFAGPTTVQSLGPVGMMLRRGISLGVGSVLTPDAARQAIRAGAAFVAAPNVNPELIRVCREMRVSVIPGAFTATEIVQAWDLGANLVSVFPVGLLGPVYIKEILSALPEVRLVPMGDIRLENVGDFIRAGAAAVGVGDEIASKDLLARREFSEITRRARAFVEAVQRARGQVARPGQPVRPIEGPDAR